MSRFFGGLPRFAALTALLVTGLAAPGPLAAATDGEALTDLVNVLREEGLIDDDQHADLALKAARKQEKRAWSERVSIWADFRTRYESFFFDRDSVSGRLDAADPTGNSRLHDRQRARIRGRINLRGEVASRAAVYFRFAAGNTDPRSNDRTLGSPGPDFDSDPVVMDLAYAALSPFPGGELPGVEDGFLMAEIGKVPNPYRWGALGPDGLPWDGDLTFEGGTLRVRGKLGPLSLFSHSGVYVLDENSKGKDPKLAATQLGFTAPLADDVTLGGRGSVYHFFSLDGRPGGGAGDTSFFAGPGSRTAAVGNIPDGLTRGTNSIQVLETAAFLDLTFSELFPVKLFASYLHNLSARQSQLFPGVSREDDAYSAGVWVGDKKRTALLGVAYYWIEANSFPAQFIDSDHTDGLANRRGFSGIVQRQLFEGVDFVYTWLLLDRINTGTPFDTSVAAADRFRMRFDLVFKF